MPALVASAHGVVLELGPATGNQLERFDAARIEHVYGVEPNTGFARAFAARLGATRLGQDGKYTLVPCGVEDEAALAGYGLAEGTVDCVLSIQVMVSCWPSYGDLGRSFVCAFVGRGRACGD